MSVLLELTETDPSQAGLLLKQRFADSTSCLGGLLFISNITSGASALSSG